MNPKFLEVLACPADKGELKEDNGSVICTVCHRVYAIDQDIIHFVEEEERPHNPKALAERFESFHSMALYHKNAQWAKRRYEEDSHVREYVDFIAGCRGVIVDLATGPGGGYIAPILEHLNPEGLLIATDACVPVIKFQSELFKPNYGNQFEFIDADLGKSLPFKTNSVDVFCGVETVNIEQISITLQEVARSLKPSGHVILSERFYAEDSETKELLTQYGHVFASFDAFQEHCQKIGLTISRYDEVLKRRGKSDPNDGLPLKETDEWTVAHIFLKKMEA